MRVKYPGLGGRGGRPPQAIGVTFWPRQEPKCSVIFWFSPPSLPCCPRCRRASPVGTWAT